MALSQHMQRGAAPQSAARFEESGARGRLGFKALVIYATAKRHWGVCDGPYRAALVATPGFLEPRTIKTPPGDEQPITERPDRIEGRLLRVGGRLRTLTSSLAKPGQGQGL